MSAIQDQTFFCIKSKKDWSCTPIGWADYSEEENPLSQLRNLQSILYSSSNPPAGKLTAMEAAH